MLNTRYGSTEVIANAALNTGQEMDVVEEQLLRCDIRKAIATIDRLNAYAGKEHVTPEEEQAIRRLNEWCYAGSEV